jgi:hypothetical protein
MGKFGKRMTKFAKSPKGQKLLDKAKRKAKDPKTRAKPEKEARPQEPASAIQRGGVERASGGTGQALHCGGLRRRSRQG